MIPFWCLMPKGRKLRPKQMDQLPLVNFENNRVRTFDLSKILLLQNLVSCGGEFMIMGKGGVFGSWSISLLDYISLCPKNEFDLEIVKWIWFAKTNQVVAKSDPNMPNYVKNKLVLNCIDVAHLLVAFGCVGINHQKGGDWKGNVPLGHFYNVLVIKCPTHIL
jgi:hypothetical protein